MENILRRTLEAGEVAIVPASCQLSFQAGMRSAILYMVKQLSEQLPYQLLYGRQLTGGRSPVVWPEVWSEMLVLCTVTRVQTKEKTATRARKHREDNQRSSPTIGDV